MAKVDCCYELAHVQQNLLRLAPPNLCFAVLLGGKSCVECNSKKSLFRTIDRHAIIINTSSEETISQDLCSKPSNQGQIPKVGGFYSSKQQKVGMV